jgi:protein TonB
LIARLSSWQSSLAIHGMILVLGVGVILWPKRPVEFIEVPIYQEAAPENVQVLKPETQKPVVLKSVNEPAPSKLPARAIFGASKNSYTSEDGVAEAKRGNTLAKAVDATVLTKDDAEALPTPTDEFLVSQMPVVLSEVKPIYPPKAREARQEGSVVVDALIDAKGLVRQVQVVEGADVFREAALTALRQFRFKPALVEGRPVAVRIRYTLRFRLEL